MHLIRTQEIAINSKIHMKIKFVKMVMVLGVLILPFALTSCLDDNSETPEETLVKQVAEIDEYLAANHINAVEDPRGVRMAITEMGTGLPAVGTNKVDVDYEGKIFGTSTVFDEGNTKGTVTGYISGWQIALTTLPRGSKATLFIPAYWGYGNAAQGPIPANSILVFDITFKDVIESAGELQTFTSDTTAIDTYLDSKSIVATKDTTGFRYVITQIGTGAVPSWYDRLKFSFNIKLLSDDTKIVYEKTIETDDYLNRPVDYTQAMNTALQKLPAGSKITVYAPSGLAFGPNGLRDQAGQLLVPANANVIIEMELNEVVRQ
jgi:FKBP-type peptidyl-prolyl cis-trans isomerase